MWRKKNISDSDRNRTPVVQPVILLTELTWKNAVCWSRQWGAGKNIWPEDEATAGQERLYKLELHNVHSSPNIKR
jgi:hypothetical protein